ncbi:hypothetical protein AYL99_04666 [Fonsecaea erecta]|uniref:Calcineurin-like phosphoesterase domain-containing protein n=1 Tax=Fonsecaea erecta TaxID=1367422 RepID=A0A178ZTE4_9EURO|nr:hypothetical protein AYL99_04666 [Fonsecaea erecta]OAP62463.1 hypothetical protein AYL99_04666 [Fonsecaea erecta]
MPEKIRTRLLVLSDTHGKDFGSEDRPPQRVDVALHCGDLTDGSKLDEFRNSIEMLKKLDAPLKLVIAGNHDFTMDIAAFEAKLAEASQPLEPEIVAREYGSLGQARQLFEDARSEGIVFLDEGTHYFTLEHGALLKVYASPYTPAFGPWGFQYHPNNGRRFDIEEDTDIVMTHGPPKGIMDMTHGRERAGCPDLFIAIARARPRVHCFGHIHEGWGARVVTWKDSGIDQPSHFTAINNENSPVVERLAALRITTSDSDETAQGKRARLEKLKLNKCAVTSHCSQDDYQLDAGKETLFVNASIMGHEDFMHRPWLVDLELVKHTN